MLDTLIIETSKIIQKDQCYDKLNAAGKKYILISLRKKNMVLKFAKPKKTRGTVRLLTNDTPPPPLLRKKS